MEDIDALLAAYGGPRAVRRAFREERVTSQLIRGLFKRHDGGAVLAALAAALGEHGNATLVDAVNDLLARAPSNFWSIERDSPLSRLAVQADEAWWDGDVPRNAARILLSPPVRSAWVLPALLAVRRLPADVARCVVTFIRERPAYLFFGGRGGGRPPAVMVVGDGFDGGSGSSSGSDSSGYGRRRSTSRSRSVSSGYGNSSEGSSGEGSSDSGSW